MQVPSLQARIAALRSFFHPPYCKAPAMLSCPTRIFTYLKWKNAWKTINDWNQESSSDGSTCYFFWRYWLWKKCQAEFVYYFKEDEKTLLQAHFDIMMSKVATYTSVLIDQSGWIWALTNTKVQSWMRRYFIMEHCSNGGIHQVGFCWYLSWSWIFSRDWDDE